MDEFTKGRMRVSGNEVTISMPFAKRDVEKRTVSGYATLDNVDTQGDVVLAEASLKAFERARGNLREMHEKKAVGRIIDFKEHEYLDQESGELYRGIWVTAYVSKGAQDTWEKVLDGTLSGFSIGGEINDASSEFVKEAGKTIRFVKDYDLTELSLVDNPANQLANVASIQKSLMTMQKSATTGSVTVEGIIAETEIESVFFCSNDHESVIIVGDSETAECPVCELSMENIGWFENVGDVEARVEKVKDIVKKYLSPTETEAEPSEGGVEMGLLNKSKETKPAPEDQPAEVPAAEPSEEAELREAQEGAEVDETEASDETSAEEVSAEDVEEVEDESTTLEKKFDELRTTITDTLEANKVETFEKMSELENKINEVHESFTKKASELETQVSEVGEKLTAAKARLTEFEKALDSVNSSDAVRKSAPLETESAGTVQKAREFRWGTGTFSGDSLFK